MAFCFNHVVLVLTCSELGHGRGQILGVFWSLLVHSPPPNDQQSISLFFWKHVLTVWSTECKPELVIGAQDVVSGLV